MSENKVITDWRAGLLAKAEVAESAVRSGITWGKLHTDARALWDIATEMDHQAAQISNITRELRNEAADNAIYLLETWNLAKAMPPEAQVPANFLPEFARRMGAPYRWLVKAGGPVLTRMDTILKTKDAVTNAPGRGLRWAITQALAALGLPPWTAPVLGVVALAGVGAWAYLTFLAPAARGAGGLAGLLGGGPRKKRRKRRLG
jgi:hypothetical protein